MSNYWIEDFERHFTSFSNKEVKEDVQKSIKELRQLLHKYQLVDSTEQPVDRLMSCRKITTLAKDAYSKKINYCFKATR